MPWKSLRRLLQSFNKRQRRELKLQTALRGLDGIGLFSGASGQSNGERDLGRTDVDIEQTFAAMAASGFPVKER